MAMAEYRMWDVNSYDKVSSGAKSAGDILIVNGKPEVVVRDVAAGDVGAFAVRGGVYLIEVLTGGSINARDNVYVSPVNNVYYASEGTGTHFGEALEAGDQGARILVAHNPLELPEP